jgi:hypothetical protein
MALYESQSITQKAIYAALTGDATLMSKLAGGAAGVLDQADEVTAYPYVQLGDADETVDDGFTTSRRTVRHTLHIYTRDTETQAGMAVAYSIAADLMRLLHRASLPMTGATNCYTFHEFTGRTPEPDGFTRHLVVRFRFANHE